MSVRKAFLLGALVGAGVRRTRSQRSFRLVGASLPVLTVLLFAASAGGSVWVTNARIRPLLGTDAKGDIGVSWTQAGTRINLVVPLHGQVYHALLPGPDVSRPASVGGLPFAAIVKRAGSWLVAVQTWQVAGQPRAFHVARWKGAPTKLMLSFDGARLRGQASFQGKPVTGFSPTPAGKEQRIYVDIDCLGCPGNPSSWTSIAVVAPKTDGSFAVYLRPDQRGSRYRAALAGPNLGTTLAPDAQAFTTGA